jgi:hypothetical protein
MWALFRYYALTAVLGGADAAGDGGWSMVAY